MSDLRPKRPARSEAPANAPTTAADTAAAPQPEAAETIAITEPTAQTAPQPAVTPAEPAAGIDDAWSALAASQAALARGVQEFAAEMTGIAGSGMAASTDAAIALLGARTFAETVEINAGLARRGFDTMVAGAARLSEIGATSLADASRPFWSRLGSL